MKNKVRSLIYLLDYASRTPFHFMFDEIYYKTNYDRINR